MPWTFVRGVPPRKGEYAFETEAFCGVLAETTLEAGDAASYLDRAVPFANEDLWGTLSCVVLADCGAARTLGTRLDWAIADLRYGNVGLNVWTGANFALGVTSWGAFPGHRVADIGSGIGVVHNTFLFDHPEKSVIEARSACGRSRSGSPTTARWPRSARAWFASRPTPPGRRCPPSG